MDTGLAILSVLISVALAVLGVLWSLKPPPRERHWVPMVVLGLLALGSASVTLWHQQRSEAAQSAAAEAHRGALEKLGRELALAEAARQADNAYLRAKLEDAYDANKELARYAPTIVSSLARVNAERKVVSSTEVRRRTLEVVARMRVVEQNFEQEFVLTRFRDLVQKQQASLQPTDSENKVRWWTQAELNTAYTKALFERDRAFKTLRPEAVYVRNELLNRTGTPAPLGGQIADVFDRGVLSGSSPLANAATYLEGLLQKLPP